MSYRKKHIKSKIHSIRPKKSIFKKAWFWLGTLIIIIISVFVYFSIFFSGVQIKNIVISGNQRITSVGIQSIISDGINTKIFNVGSWAVVSRSIFLVDSKKIIAGLLEKFPTIASANVSRNFFQSLTVKVNERTPVAILCPTPDSTREGSAPQCYLIDSKGIVFEPAPAATDNLPIIQQKVDGGAIGVGESAVAQNMMDLFIKILNDLRDNLQIDIKKALIASTRLNVTTNENWQIYFDLDKDHNINSQITNLNILLSGGKNGISPAERKNLRYIDLRPKDKAIICDNKICGG